MASYSMLDVRYCHHIHDTLEEAVDYTLSQPWKPRISSECWPVSHKYEEVNTADYSVRHERRFVLMTFGLGV